jgi:hypothetical protein
MQASDDMTRQSEHKDIAHPITTECRDYIQKKVLEAYDIETKGPSSSSAAPKSVSEQKPAAESRPVSEALPRRVIEEESDIEL